MTRRTTLLAALAAAVLLALPGVAAADAQAYYKAGSTGKIARNDPGCNAWISGSTALAKCSLGNFERLVWSAPGYFTHDQISYYGPNACVNNVKLTYDGYRSHAYWRFGSWYRGCSVTVNWVNFTR